MKTIHTENAPKAIGPYSQAKVVGHLLFISGQLPINPEIGYINTDNITDQAKQAASNVKEILEAAGSNLDNVIKTTCFLSSMGDFADFNAVYEDFFVSKPSRSCVEVSKLPQNALCEIEVIAFIGNH